MNKINRKYLIIAILVLGAISAIFYFRENLKIALGGYEKTPRGYHYRFIEGKKLNSVMGPGYHIVFQYLLISPNGDTIENKAQPGVEMVREYPVEAKNEMDDAMQMGSAGSVIEILVPTDSLKLRVIDNMKIMAMPSGKKAKFVLKIAQLLNEQDYEAYKNQQFLSRFKKENDAIDAFAAKQKKSWVLDSFSHIKYYIENKTNNPRFKEGDKIEFHAEVYTLQGALLINSAMEGRKYSITIGKSNYQLTAFDAVAYYLSDGESGDFLVTSEYGYGAQGYLNIVPPYSPLLVKIKELKKIQ